VARLHSFSFEAFGAFRLPRILVRRSGLLGQQNGLTDDILQTEIWEGRLDVKGSNLMERRRTNLFWLGYGSEQNLNMRILIKGSDSDDSISLLVGQLGRRLFSRPGGWDGDDLCLEL
jgi:hypothetical protein